MGRSPNQTRPGHQNCKESRLLTAARVVLAVGRLSLRKSDQLTIGPTALVLGVLLRIGEKGCRSKSLAS